jgi:quercetin dioxygenase-like cupin family protein
MGPTFTGEVYITKYQSPGDGSAFVGNVTFLPGSRSYWHTHENGQVLTVLQGSGWVCDRGEEPKRIKVGDVIYCKPGTTHWHGADKETIMTHTAVGMGKTTWLEEVKEEEYPKE